MTTNEYFRNVRRQNWRPVSQRLWQRNYYEHVIRNEESLNKIREYIVNNPFQWALDVANPGTRSNTVVWAKSQRVEKDFWEGLKRSGL